MSIRDLRRPTAEIDEHDTADLPAGTAPTVASRRSFLRRAAAGGALAAGATAVPVAALIPSALAQSTTPGTGGVTSGTTPGTAVAGTTVPSSATARKKDPPKVEGNDLDIVVFMQTIELAAEAAYTAMAAGGRLSSPVAEGARVAAMQHRDHADALKTFAGGEARNEPNGTLARQLLPRISAATAARELAQIAYDLEEAITASWSAAMAEIESWEVAELAATIMPVTSQQALAWSLQVEDDIEVWARDIKDWIPNFQNDSGRLDPARYPAA